MSASIHNGRKVLREAVPSKVLLLRGEIHDDKLANNGEILFCGDFIFGQVKSPSLSTFT